jgi:hypothetical protein
MFKKLVSAFLIASCSLASAQTLPTAPRFTTPSAGTNDTTAATTGFVARDFISKGAPSIPSFTTPGILTNNASGVISSITALPGVVNVAALRLLMPVATFGATTLGYTTAGDGGGASYRAVVGAAAATYVDNGGSIIVPTGGDGSAAWLLNVGTTIDVRQFGARPAGLDGLDNSPAIQAALTQLRVNGGILRIPEGLSCYSLASALTFDGGIGHNWKIEGGGTLCPTNAVTTAALTVSNGYIPNFGTISGLTFDFRNNTGLQYGLKLLGTAGIQVKDNTFILDQSGTFKAGFASVYLGPVTPGNPDTNTFWANIENNKFRPYSGGGALPATDITMVGQANATRIVGNVFSTGAVAIQQLEDLSNANGLANAVFIYGNAFEGVTTAVSIKITPGGYWTTGWFLTLNRVEATTTFISLTTGGAAGISSAQPLTSVNNTIINSSVTAYLVNPTNATVNVDEPAAYMAATGFGSTRTYPSGYAAKVGTGFNFNISDQSGNSAYNGGHILMGGFGHMFLNGATGTLQYKAGTPTSPTDGYSVNGVGTFTVATLPSAPSDGNWAIASDLTALTCGGTPVGGGAVRFRVTVMGGAWKMC